MVDQRHHFVSFVRCWTFLRDELAPIDGSGCGVNSAATLFDHGQLVSRVATHRVDFGDQLAAGPVAGPNKKWIERMEASVRYIGKKRWPLSS